MPRIHFRPSPEEAAFPPSGSATPALPDRLHVPRPADMEVSARGVLAAVARVRAAQDPLAAFAGLAPAARRRLAKSPEGWAWITTLLHPAAGQCPPTDTDPTDTDDDPTGLGRHAPDRPSAGRQGALWAERALQAQTGRTPEHAAVWAQYDAFLTRSGQPRKRAALAALSRPARQASGSHPSRDRAEPGHGGSQGATPKPPTSGAERVAHLAPNASGDTPSRPLQPDRDATATPPDGPGAPAAPAPAGQPAALPASSHGATVVVPVYGDARSLSACLAGLADTQGQRPWRVLLIDDCSPDPAVRALLAEREDDPRFHLRRLPENRGYIGAVAAALALVTEGDVVLLNSDCVVPGGDWIDRLAAHVGPATGTVTPLASNGQAFGFPTPFRAAPAFLGARLARIDDAARAANAGRAVRMLTSVGFCTYVTRACLDATGGLHAPGLTAGYGEEVDFCLRAQEAGFHHLAASDCYVTHLGAASFRSGKRALVRRNEAVLHRRFPTYFARFAAPCAADPLRPARARIERSLMGRDGRRGGVALVGRDSGALLGTRTAWTALQRGEPLRLIEVDALAAPQATARLTSPGLLYPQNLTYRLPQDRARLAEDLAAMGAPKVMVEPALAPRAADWLGTTAFAPMPEAPAATAALPPEVHEGCEAEGYAGLYV